jgi:hypothetical protein
VHEPERGYIKQTKIPKSDFKFMKGTKVLNIKNWNENGVMIVLNIKNWNENRVVQLEEN